VEFRQLQYFTTIAKLGGFRRAADELGVSQATLSEQIKQLEGELRVPLFERNSRHLAVTEAGLALLERAEQVLFEIRAARHEMLEFADLERGFVAVGTVAPSGLQAWLPRLLATFKRLHPHVQLTLVEQTIEQLF